MPPEIVFLQTMEMLLPAMERISEGQRFTTRLLAERTADPAGPRPPAGAR